MIAILAHGLIRQNPQRPGGEKYALISASHGGAALPLNDAARERHRGEAIGDEPGEQSRLELGGERRELGPFAVGQVAPASVRPAHEREEPTALIRRRVVRSGARAIIATSPITSSLATGIRFRPGTLPAVCWMH